MPIRPSHVLILLALLSPSFLTAQTPRSVGDEFIVNSYTENNQRYVDAAADADGDFVVVWQSSATGADLDPDGYGIRAQRYASDGSALGGNFLVNSFTADSQEYPAIDMNDDGDFIVVWESYGVAVGADVDIAAQRFSSDGTAVGAEIIVNSYYPGDQSEPSVALLPDGGFVVVWHSFAAAYGDFSGDSIQARLFDSNGDPVGSDMLVNSYTTGDQNSPAVEVDADGDFLVVWESPEPIFTNTSIRGQRFSSSGGALGDEFLLDLSTSNTEQHPDLVVDSSGEFMVIWGYDDFFVANQRGVIGRRVDASGNAVGDELTIVAEESFAFPEQVSIQNLPDDGFLVAWDRFTGDFSVVGRRIDASGSPVGEDLVLNSAYTNRRSVVAADQDGDFVVVWDGSEVGVSGVDVHGQRFSIVSVIGDRVWFDEDGDGLQGGDEEGVPGVIVRLNEETLGRIEETLTDENGDYLFDEVPNGEYSLNFALPGVYSMFTTQNVGDDDEIDSDVDADGATEVFTVNGNFDLSIDAGLAQATVSGLVWHDTSADGVRDGGEPFAEDVDVNLRDADGDLVSSTFTDDDGFYEFAPAAGAVYVEIAPPAQYGFTLRNQGDDEDLDSDVNAVGATMLFEIVPAAAIEGLDAGLIGPATLGDRVWLDNGDGLQSGGETGVEGVTVNLYGADKVQVDSTVTDAGGWYAFTPAAGDYYLEVILPEDTVFAPRDQGADDADSDFFSSTGTTSIFSFAAGGVDTTRDAGLEPATIGNLIWHDLNEDGRRQPTEPGVAGVTVRLLDGDGAVVAETATDADGVYGFLDAPTGDYRLEVDPGSATFSSKDVGDDDLIDSDVDPATGRTDLFAYVAATASRSHDAGLIGVSLLFDDFESGDLSGWSLVEP